MDNIEAKQLKWEELSISNDFLFGKVMQDAELCISISKVAPERKQENIFLTTIYSRSICFYISIF